MNYIVEPNDNLISIAEKFKVSISDLIKENNLEYIYSLVPGLELIIPTTENNQEVDDNSENIDNNNEQEIIPEDTNNQENSNLFSFYIVREGDNLYQIGKRYNIPAQVLADLNGLDINAYIQPNQQILVPRDGVGLYITKDGDTMESVTKDLNVLVEDILIDNKNVYLLPNQLIAYKNLQVLDDYN